MQMLCSHILKGKLGAENGYFCQCQTLVQNAFNYRLTHFISFKNEGFLQFCYFFDRDTGMCENSRRKSEITDELCEEKLISEYVKIIRSKCGDRTRDVWIINPMRYPLGQTS